MTEEEHKKLKQLAFEKDVSVQQLFSEMVKRYLSECHKESISGNVDTCGTIEEVSKALNIAAEKITELAVLLQKK